PQVGAQGCVMGDRVVAGGAACATNGRSTPFQMHGEPCAKGTPGGDVPRAPYWLPTVGPFRRGVPPGVARRIIGSHKTRSATATPYNQPHATSCRPPLH